MTLAAPPTAARRTAATRTERTQRQRRLTRSSVSRLVSRLILAAPASNSGYMPGSSPATPQTNFDLDPQMIAACRLR